MATERLVNNGQTTVASTYTAGATSLVVTNAALLPTLSGSDQYHVIVYNSNTPTQAEIMLVTAVAGNTLTVTPAQEAVAGVQTSFDHAAGDVVAAVLTVESLTAVVEQLSLNQTEADALYQPADPQLTSLAGLAYAGNAAKVVRVNAGETAFELATVTGAGDVVGPSSATDNALARFNGTTGKLIQDSAVTVADSGVPTIRVTNDGVGGSDIILNLYHYSTETVANGFGSSVMLGLQTTDGTLQISGEIRTSWVNATTGSRRSRMTFWVSTVGADSEALRLEADASGVAKMSVLGAAASARLVSPDAGTALVTFGFASGTPTFAWANVTGATTVGSNLVTLTNPSAITFLRVNADNTVSALSDSDFRTAIGSLASSMLDTDGTLAANSDAKIPSQKAVKTYVDNAVTSLWDWQGTIAANTNPNYPAASAGDAYAITTVGKIGGINGPIVEVGDLVVALNDNAGGTHAAVGSDWVIFEHNLTGAMIASNNLSDVGSVAQAKINLGVTLVGDALFTLPNPSAVRFIRIDADNGVSALSDGDFRTAIGAQPLDAALTALAAGSDFVQFTGPATETKVFTLPDANATLLYAGGALGTPSSGTLTNCAGLPDTGVTFTDVTTGNASTTAHGYSPKATAPAAGLLSVLGIGNGETVRSDKPLFDTTNPAALGTAAPGTQVIAARRDHVHTLPKLDDLAAPDDNTDLNASTTAHGLLKKLSNVATEFMNGVGNWAVPTGSLNYTSPSGMRLTLTSGTPVTTSDVTAAGTIYLAVYKADFLMVPNSGATDFDAQAPGELSLSLTLTDAKNYDLFCWNNSGTMTLALSSAWTNDTTRADALGTLKGIKVNNATIGSMGAKRGIWLGTIRASGSNTTEDSITARFVWNQYNDVPRKLWIKDTTGSWSHNGTWRQVRAQTSNRVRVVVGESGRTLWLNAWLFKSPDVGFLAQTGIGLNSTTVDSADLGDNPGIAGNWYGAARASLVHATALGYHAYNWLEQSSGGSTTFNGGSSSGMHGEIRC